jgi:hypothetical protein
MANRLTTIQQGALVKGIVTIYARVNIGATGAPTLQKWNPSSRTYTAAPTSGSGPYAIGAEGVKSISRVSAGVYLLTLQDTWQRFVSFRASVSNATGLPTTALIGLWTTGTDVTAAAPAIKFTTLGLAAGPAYAATDPVSGDVLNIKIVLQNSSAL